MLKTFSYNFFIKIERNLGEKIFFVISVISETSFFRLIFYCVILAIVRSFVDGFGRSYYQFFFLNSHYTEFNLATVNIAITQKRRDFMVTWGFGETWTDYFPRTNFPPRKNSIRENRYSLTAFFLTQYTWRRTTIDLEAEAVREKRCSVWISTNVAIERHQQPWCEMWFIVFGSVKFAAKDWMFRTQKQRAVRIWSSVSHWFPIQCKWSSYKATVNGVCVNAVRFVFFFYLSHEYSTQSHSVFLGQLLACEMNSLQTDECQHSHALALCFAHIVRASSRMHDVTDSISYNTCLRTGCFIYACVRNCRSDRIGRLHSQNGWVRKSFLLFASRRQFMA